jgi:hypothetical protein
MRKCETMTYRSLTDIILDKDLVSDRINVIESCETRYKLLVHDYIRPIHYTDEYIISKREGKHILCKNSDDPRVVENVIGHCQVMSIVYVNTIGLAVHKRSTNNARCIVTIGSVEENKS